MPTTEPTTLRYRCGTKGAFYEVVCTVCTVSGATSRPLVIGPYRSEEAALRGFNQHVACIHHHNMLKRRTSSWQQVSVRNKSPHASTTA